MAVKAKRLPSGSWRCQVYAGKNAEGKNQYRSFTCPTKREAEYQAAQFSMHYREIARDSTAMTLYHGKAGSGKGDGHYGVYSQYPRELFVPASENHPTEERASGHPIP